MKKKILAIAETLIIILTIATLYYTIKFVQKKILEVLIVTIILYSLVLYYHFFFLYKFKSNKIKGKIDLERIRKLNTLHKIDLMISSSRHSISYAQPINLILTTNKNIKKIMEKIKWTECQTFAQHDIKLIPFFKNLITSKPPMTDAYFLKNPQDLAYQKNAKFRKRDHIRFWELGTTKEKKTLYLASISQDKNFSIKKHNGLYSPSHSIDPNVDKLRDSFSNEILERFPLTKLSKEKMHEKIPKRYQKRKKLNYYTDGYINILDF